MLKAGCAIKKVWGTHLRVTTWAIPSFSVPGGVVTTSRREACKAFIVLGFSRLFLLLSYYRAESRKIVQI